MVLLINQFAAIRYAEVWHTCPQRSDEHYWIVGSRTKYLCLRTACLLRPSWTLSQPELVTTVQSLQARYVSLPLIYAYLPCNKSLEVVVGSIDSSSEDIQLSFSEFVCLRKHMSYTIPNSGQDQALCAAPHRPFFTCRCVRYAALYWYGGARVNTISYLNRTSKNISQSIGNESL